MTHHVSISRRAASIQPSATMAVAAHAARLKAEGRPLLNLAAGEPDFAPPAAVRAAVAEMSRTEAVGYTPVAGTSELREAVAAELTEVHETVFGPQQVLISCGAKHSLANLFYASIDPGDEVVIPAPYWVSYPEIVRLAGGKPVIAPTQRDEGWRLRPDVLDRVVGAKTRWVILNSPSNPTGAGYRAEDIRALGEVLRFRAPQAWWVCDDIYRQLTYDGFTFASARQALEEVTEQIVHVDGVSKTYAMTGYRIGFLAGPQALVDAAAKIQGQTTSGACSLAQRGAFVALTDPSVATDVATMREAFSARRTLMLQGLASVPSVEVDPPDGAFYVLVDVSAYTGAGANHSDDVAIATWLLEEKCVATVPGTAFGAPGFLRLSYAADEQTITEGCRKIAEAMAGLPLGRVI